MEQRVVINLGQGSWQTGFPTVIVQLWEDQEAVPMQFVGRLPAAPELLQLFEQWQAYFRVLNSSLRIRQSPVETSIEIEKGDITHVSRNEFDNLCHELKNQFNNWLGVSSFINVDRGLRTYLSISNSIQLIIAAEDASVQRFPWHLCFFLEDYPQAEVAISSLEHMKVKLLPKQARSKVRVLSVLGDTTYIEVDRDRDMLKQLTDVETVVLSEPDRSELNHHLWDEQRWDIFFFAGHSCSEQGGNSGLLKINAREKFPSLS